jgi:hypothetical protein
MMDDGAVFRHSMKNSLQEVATGAGDKEKRVGEMVPPNVNGFRAHSWASK